MIKGNIDTLKVTIVATAAIAERHLVGFDGAPTGANGKVYGVAANDASIGDAVAITALGLVDLVAGGAIAAGDSVVSDADGKPVTQGAGTNPFGVAVTAAANPGDTVRVLIR